MLYFDNAATTYPKPQNVITAVNTAIINYGGNPGRGGHKMAMNVSSKIYDIRKRIGEMFNADAENVIFTQNCTHALNTAIKGVLKANDHVICSDLEHNSVIRPIYKLSLEKGIKYSIAITNDLSDEKTVDAFDRLINENTKAIVCTYASNVTGRVLPITKIAKLCKDNNIIFIVDAAQAAGIFDIDIVKDGINILCMPGHKGMYGVSGTGIMITDGKTDINSLIEGGTGSLSVQLTNPDFSPDKFESGTINVPGIFSLGAGVNFLKSKEINRIYDHEYNICKSFYNGLTKIKGIVLYTPDFDYKKYAPVVSFNIKDIPSDEMAIKFSDMGFALRGGLHCSPLAHKHYGTEDVGMIRFSPSVFTKPYEVNNFLNKIERISKK